MEDYSHTYQGCSRKKPVEVSVLVPFEILRRSRSRDYLMLDDTNLSQKGQRSRLLSRIGASRLCQRCRCFIIWHESKGSIDALASCRFVSPHHVIWIQSMKMLEAKTVILTKILENVLLSQSCILVAWIWFVQQAS